MILLWEIPKAIWPYGLFLSCLILKAIFIRAFPPIPLALQEQTSRQVSTEKEYGVKENQETWVWQARLTYSSILSKSQDLFLLDSTNTCNEYKRTECMTVNSLGVSLFYRQIFPRGAVKGGSGEVVCFFFRMLIRASSKTDETELLTANLETLYYLPPPSLGLTGKWTVKVLYQQFSTRLLKSSNPAVVTHLNSENLAHCIWLQTFSMHLLYVLKVLRSSTKQKVLF